ncbi:gamma-glutamylcyclotransferase [Alkalicoccus luteus]|uniref:Gamma-glutamylcyclotransferase family protein n=1 Tax=Alkalicoccus luteus TaxID=1237094 RepID=A0A969PN72_9BACI|nr:gamma-glutamylcyclotransferase [Alkalicoccus luteus]
MKLFVYGTLMTGEGNHFFLTKARRLADRARVKGDLYDTGFGYPALVRGDGDVWGELYEVTSELLPAIDELEGFRAGRNWNLYYRTTTDVITNFGLQKALVYYYNKPVQSGNKIYSGDWKARS